ncbi:MAG: cytochrome c oxidase subunit 3, partial [Mycobacteriales bacterium]
MASASASEHRPRGALNRPNLLSVGVIVWLSSELMFFAALFAIYFTIRSVNGGIHHWPPPDVHLNLPFASIN